MSLKIVVSLLFIVLSFSPVSFAESQAEMAWSALKRGEAIALLRHSHAPHNENHDSYFDAKKCQGERNLSPAGQQQSIRMGEIFKQQGITKANVYSSYFCRCIDTGKFLELGEVELFEPIYSTFDEPEKKQERRLRLTAWLKQTVQDKNAINILSTHAFNIRDMFNIYVAEGEVLIVAIENDQPVILHQFIAPTI